MLITLRMGWVLRRSDDGLFFHDRADADGNHIEFGEGMTQAREWASLDSCAAAARTWNLIKGEYLEVVPTPAR